MKQLQWSENIALVPTLMEDLKYRVGADNREIRGKARQYVLCEFDAELFDEIQTIPFIYRLYGNNVILEYCYPLTRTQYTLLKPKDLKDDKYIKSNVYTLLHSYYLRSVITFSLTSDLSFDDAFLFVQERMENILELIE